MSRESGVLLHVTSLPGGEGIGDFGPEAYRFVDFLHGTGQKVWQVLPIGPTGYGNSPYQSFSAFAGNPFLISGVLLAEQGLLNPHEIPQVANGDRVDFEEVTRLRDSLLRQAFANFRSGSFGGLQWEAGQFATKHAEWLDDYALFQAIKGAHNLVAWTDWEPGARSRDPSVLARYRDQLREEIEFQRFVQFEFYLQWMNLKRYANGRGISIIGDLPIFVAHDSSDVWTNQDQFYLHENGRPQVVAGVPPDYFSATGQLWGNPIYHWEKMASEDYAWWTRRIRGALDLFDRIRIDHFRGFEAYWEVPGEATVASGGRWVPGPGATLFEAARRALRPDGQLPVIAEDLGVITPEVDALRDQLGFPGMRVLQFAFGGDPKARDYQPHRYPRECLVYTGTHDNDTTVGWFRSQAGEGTTRHQAEVDRERDFALRYMHSDGREVHWDAIRLALASVANTAIFPMQDLLGLGSEARMNLPGTSHANWQWRFRWDMVTREVESRLAEITWLYERGEPRL